MAEGYKGRVVVFSITGCSHCNGAKSLLTERNIPFVDVNLDTFPNLREEVKWRTNRSTVPQIFFNNIHVGGNEELQKLMKNEDKWQALIEEIKENEPPEDAPSPPAQNASDGADSKDDSGPVFKCEEDELYHLAKEIEGSGVLKNHRQGLFHVVHCSVTCEEVVCWMKETKNMDQETAVETAKQLVERHFLVPLRKGTTFKDDNNALYRMIGYQSDNALNSVPIPECKPRPAFEVAEEMRKLILKLYSEFLSSDGKKVDYRGLGASESFKEYKKLTTELQRVNLKDLSREETIAFFINIYNSLVVHATVIRGPPTTLWQRWKFFNSVSYIIGGHLFSLQDIENGVLRGNKRGVGMFFCPFGEGDPRLQFVMNEVDPRIHFALVCGAKSCPPIKTYSPQNINRELQLATEAFLESEDGVKISDEQSHVQLSSIFKWYKSDFGSSNEELLRWLYQQMNNGEKKKLLGGVIQDLKRKVSYIPYNWDLNSA